MVEAVMQRKKEGTLKSGSGKKVTSKKQAIIIGLSEAREKGVKVPKAPARKSKGIDAPILASGLMSWQVVPQKLQGINKTGL